MNNNQNNESELYLAYENTRTANLLNDQAVELCKRGEYEPALKLAKEALEFAEKGRNLSAIGRANNIIGIVKRNQGLYSLAFEYFNKSLDCFQDDSELQNKATVLGNIGVIFKNISQYGKALEYYQKALAISDKLESKEISATILGNIGNIYRAMEDYPRALQFQQKALAISEEADDKHAISIHLGNIVNIYANISEFNLALEYFSKALKISEELSNQSSIMHHLGNIGIVYYDLAKFDVAIEYFLKALESAKEIGDSSKIAAWLGNIGQTYANSNYESFNYEIAEKNLLESISMYEEIGNNAGQAQFLKELSNLYKQQERWKDFAVSFERYHELNNQVKSLEAKQQAEKFVYDREIELMNHERALLSQKNIELNEANQFKSKLLGVAAHDLKNPLNNIIGSAQLVLSELTDDSEHKEWLVAILSSAKRMAGLVSDLLESSAASLGAILIKPEIFNLSDTVRKIVAIFSTPATKKNQQIDCQIDENVLVHGDEARMIQVLDNLVSNAIKYSPFQADIFVRLSRSGESIRLEVQDEGQGLSEADLTKLFGQFQRLSSLPTGGEHSTGLGLHIAKHIVELHGGKIWAESKGKAQGTTFFVELPQEQN